MQLIIINCVTLYQIVIIARIVFIHSFFFYWLLLNHSFKTSLNNITNLSKLIIFLLQLHLLLRRFQETFERRTPKPKKSKFIIEEPEDYNEEDENEDDFEIDSSTTEIIEDEEEEDFDSGVEDEMTVKEMRSEISMTLGK